MVINGTETLDFGTTIDTILNDGRWEKVFGGIAVGTTVNDGGRENVERDIQDAQCARIVLKNQPCQRGLS
jgi:autotransporter passenger strand-loop-strand repeat protein